MKRVHLYVTGSVQGVFFRQATRQEAERLNVKGWVRNLPDGRVEATFEGTPFAVDAMVQWCHHGPGRARVRYVEVREEEPAGAGAGGASEGFQVLR